MGKNYTISTDAKNIRSGNFANVNYSGVILNDHENMRRLQRT